MSGCTRAVPVRLTVKRRRKPEQIVAAGTSPQRLVLRARTVLGAAARAAAAAIARDLGCSVVTVRTWRHRFACRGIPGLFDRPRSRRPETHGPSARLAVVAVATSVKIPVRTGRDARREFEYVRHGPVSIIAAMNVATGEVIAERIEKDDSAAFTAFLAMLHQMIPPRLRIHLICDNGSFHTSAATRAWLAAHPRFEVTYTPRHASWFNIIEQ